VNVTSEQSAERNCASLRVPARPSRFGDLRASCAVRTTCAYGTSQHERVNVGTPGLRLAGLVQHDLGRVRGDARRNDDRGGRDHAHHRVVRLAEGHARVTEWARDAFGDRVAIFALSEW
jgi:hypothetical protein